MTLKPQILHVTTVARSRLFSIEQVDLRFGNGTEVAYERLQGQAGGAVLIVPMRDADTVLLIREYAVGVERYELGLPKGRLEPGEAVLDTANRELMEELGYGARRLTEIARLTVAPGYFGHITHVILAEDLYPQHRAGDEPEPVEVVPWALHDFERLLTRDDFSEARTIAALYMARARLNNDG